MYNEPIWQFEWRWQVGAEAAADAQLLAECAALFSAHYGRWAPTGPRPGERIKMWPDYVARLLSDPGARLASAFTDGRLVGYAVALQLDITGCGRVMWVTQLVVHEQFRHLRVATRLLYGIWQFSDCYAWGLVTANPLAVRALETATRRPCRTALITAHAPLLLRHLADHVQYIPPQLVTTHSGTLPKVDTAFHVSHEDLPALRTKARRSDRRWALGDLSDGEEWFACTFGDQRPALDADRLRHVLRGADEIWMRAYEAMSLDEHHHWRRGTTAEVEFVVNASGLAPGGSVLDIGCGDGRHAAEFARRGYVATGVDVSERLIARVPRPLPERMTIERADARENLPDGPFDAAIALYDVIGSSADTDDDLAILRNARRRLRPGGTLVISVMNATPVLANIPSAQRASSMADLLRALERLQPSNTMQSTGDVFNADLIVEHARLFYRKEQFEAEWMLPTEMVVRDRRFTLPEIRDLVLRAGFAVESVTPVQATRWTRQPPLDDGDPRAKELLVVARAPG